MRNCPSESVERRAALVHDRAGELLGGAHLREPGRRLAGGEHDARARLAEPVHRRAEHGRPRPQADELEAAAGARPCGRRAPARRSHRLAAGSLRPRAHLRELERSSASVAHEPGDAGLAHEHDLERARGALGRDLFACEREPIGRDPQRQLRGRRHRAKFEAPVLVRDGGLRRRRGVGHTRAPEQVPLVGVAGEEVRSGHRRAEFVAHAAANPRTLRSDAERHLDARARRAGDDHRGAERAVARARRAPGSARRRAPRSVRRRARARSTSPRRRPRVGPRATARRRARASPARRAPRPRRARRPAPRARRCCRLARARARRSRRASGRTRGRPARPRPPRGRTRARDRAAGRDRGTRGRRFRLRRASRPFLVRRAGSGSAKRANRARGPRRAARAARRARRGAGQGRWRARTKARAAATICSSVTSTTAVAGPSGT